MYKCSYLSFESKDKASLRISNYEIEGELICKLKEYYATMYKFYGTLLVEYAKFFNMIAKKTTLPSKRVEYSEELNSFYKAFRALASHNKEINNENICNEADIMLPRLAIQQVLN